MRDLIYKILKESEDEFDWVDRSVSLNPDESLMKYLIDNYRLRELPSTHIVYPNKKYIMVDDKPYFIERNKKYLTNKIYWEVYDDFKYIGEPILRKTIRQFLNDIFAD